MKDQMASLPSRSGEQGFSLIEVAIIVTIIGLLITPFIIQYNVDQQQKRLNFARANLSVIKASLQKYAVKYGEYPLPSNPSIASGALGYGTSILTPPSTACTPIVMEACVTAGRRDTLGDGSPTTIQPGDPDPVYIGTVPFATLGLTESQSIDAYHNKFTYAVSGLLTNNATFDEGYGVIRLQGSDGIPRDSAADDNAHFVILSHGSDGKGAFSQSGIRVAPCDDPSLARDNQNCNNDSVFDDGTILNPVTGERPISRALANGSLYWDDFYEYTATTSSDFWLPLANETNMSNRNTGSVLINMTTATDPTVRVDVNGVTRAEALYTTALCSGNAGTACIAPIKIGTETLPTPNATTTIRCSAGEAMTGINNGRVVCAPPAITAEALVFNCPTGTLPRGINAGGTIYCEAP